MADARAPRCTVFPLDLGAVTLPPGHPQGGGSYPIVAHAIAHPEGVFLFDTGVGEGNAEIDEYFRPIRVPLADALAAHGFSFGDITALANRHLHFDHVGENRRFPGVPIFAQEREHGMVHEADYTVPEWVDFAGAKYDLLDGEAEVAPGVRLLPTPGHTRGHQSLVVEDGTGVVLIVGQALLTAAEWAAGRDGWADAVVSGMAGAWDEAAYEASVDLLRSVDPDRVHFTHDRSV